MKKMMPVIIGLLVGALSILAIVVGLDGVETAAAAAAAAAASGSAAASAAGGAP